MTYPLTILDGPGSDPAARPLVEQPLLTATRPFHLMTKPIGPICNLDCRYCFYLEKEKLYGDQRKWKMSDELLERYIAQYIAAQPVREVSFAWQGGEPTLLGVDFFRRVLELQSKHANGKRITNALQTNGTLLDDEWCQLLAKHRFLVGLSVDGPRELHDFYRVDKQGKPTFDAVWRGLKLLKKHGVEFNTLTVVNRANSKEPLKVYKFLREFGSGFMQFIPLVERKYIGTELPLDLAPPVEPGQEADRSPVTDWSVESRQYGKFLTTIFDEWVRRDVGKMFVQTFDVALGSWAGAAEPVRVLADVWQGARNRAQRRRLQLRPLRLPESQAWQHCNDAAGDAGGLAVPAQVRDGQAGRVAEVLPRVFGEVRLPRRMPEAPFHPHARRRAGPELPVRGVQALLHAHRPVHEDDGRAAEAPAAAGGDHADVEGGAVRDCGLSPSPGTPGEGTGSRDATEYRLTSSR
ncbi:MAG: radical SAM protein [Tepidisphaeraceae bacterium]